MTIPRPTRAFGTLLLLLIAQLMASLYWIQTNITPYGRDAGGHLTRALQHAEILREVTWQTLFQAITFHDFRPPALYLAAQIPYRLFGWGMDSALYTNVVFLAVILLFTYLIAKRMMPHSQWLPVLAVAVAGFLPMLAAMARTFYLDGFLTAALLVILYALLRSNNFTHKGWTVVWGIAIGVGMLVLRVAFQFVAKSMGITAPSRSSVEIFFYCIRGGRVNFNRLVSAQS
jgi:4-amino-4-deoxy-L-arabinose transferase-like glycosyltransferase